MLDVTEVQPLTVAGLSAVDSHTWWPWDGRVKNWVAVEEYDPQ